ncbi:hypothetical protein GCM10025865_23040 [Paraoerskovia sediminicola]|uniref:Methionine synthase n=1 Tax=Paraoerskovia sediminicola TaxID=1138587 RepID=A0ABN6XHD3_9CELL|nr:hypothetical protein [Paraoerskovia sediminicola]BDZ43005.1 hypothetical protein GCM10025865_23040 [Paraoerskovia sediminicola]
MTAVSGHGPRPGTDPLEAQQVVLGDLVELPTGVDAVPFLTQLPSRGIEAGALGRTVALLAELPAELGPHGWKLADRPGADLRRAGSLLAEDVAALAIAAYGYTGPLAVGVTGPWSAAAELYLARGDRVLADTGARAELAASLAAGVADHVADVRRQVPGADVVVQLEEPLLAQVGAGVLPTFSGFSRIRAVHGPEVVDGLRAVVDAARAAGARVVAHVGSAWSGIGPAVLAGVDAVGVDLTPGRWDERLWTDLAKAHERGVPLWAGLPPAQVSQCAGPDVVALADAIGVPWRRIGLPVRGLADVVLLESGRAIADGSLDAARAVTGNLGRAAAVLAERADG